MFEMGSEGVRFLFVFELRIVKNGQRSDSLAAHFEQHFMPVFNCTDVF